MTIAINMRMNRNIVSSKHDLKKKKNKIIVIHVLNKTVLLSAKQ